MRLKRLVEWVVLLTCLAALAATLLGCCPGPDCKSTAVQRGCDRCHRPAIVQDLSLCIYCNQWRCKDCVPCRTCRDESVGR